MLTLRGVFVSTALFAFVFACAKAEDQGFLAPQDLESPEDAEFDPNDVIRLDELTDSTVRPDLLNALLTYRLLDKIRKNPYGRDSFLSTYYSNGLSAIDALINASETHRINPLVILARAQIAQGLVAMQHYPVDNPARVEYVFGCGCTGPESCDPNYAGFDRQVDCLARQYRVILTDMEKNGGVTAGGWGKGREGRTIDGSTVVPTDEGTAAAYQFDPRVGEKDRGNRLFWNVWKLYGRSGAYEGPSGGSDTGAWIGDPCSSKESCSALGQIGQCITTYPGGMCTVNCQAAQCPAREGRESVCVDTGSGAYCFAKCNTSVQTCRGGSNEWACCAVRVFPPAANTTQSVCTVLPAGQVGCGG